MAVRESQIDQVVKRMAVDGLAQGLLYELVSAAASYFEECPSDFCLQHADERVAIFGGTNRLKWTLMEGFRPDRTYCTQAFLAHADSMRP